MKFKPYPKYVDSGVEWLGEIPEGWTVQSLSWISYVIADGTHFSPESFSDGDYKYVTAKNITNSGFDFSEISYIPEETHKEIYTRCPVIKGDVLLIKDGATAGTVMINDIDEPFSLLSSVAMIRPDRKKILETILRYFLSSKIHLDLSRSRVIGGAMTRFTLEMIAKFKIVVPQLPVQSIIASFLDSSTARIDSLIQDYEELIALLQEKRQALIAHAVTRGLSELVRPDDPDFGEWAKPAKFVDSGVEWLGEIPEGWLCRKFNHCVFIQEGQVDPKDDESMNQILIAPNHIESGTGRLLYTETATEQNAVSGKYACRKGDVIYSKIRPKLAKATIAEQDCLCSADMYPLRSSLLISPYLLYFLITPQFTNWAVLESERVAMPKINRDSLGLLKLPVPEKKEQTTISAFLTRETTKIDALDKETQDAIELLKEHRAALITNAVTGKINVEEYD